MSKIFHVTYYVEIDGREHVFFLKEMKDGKVYFTVPDVGGQADMVPKFPEQLEWTEKRIEFLKGNKRVWPTVWEVKSKDPVVLIEDFLNKHAKIIKSNKIDY